MKHRAASRAVSRIATPKNCAASRGVFIIPRKRDKEQGGEMNFQPILAKENQIAQAIVNSAFAVHSVLGPGLGESIYETCFCRELTKRNLPFRRQAPVSIIYDGIRFNDGLRLNVLVGGEVVCELKSVETMYSVFTAQLMTHLKLTGKRLGFLINFNAPVIKHGIKRIII
jgi:GxxExxY protein